MNSIILTGYFLRDLVVAGERSQKTSEVIGPVHINCGGWSVFRSFAFGVYHKKKQRPTPCFFYCLDVLHNLSIVVSGLRFNKNKDFTVYLS